MFSTSDFISLVRNVSCSRIVVCLSNIFMMVGGVGLDLFDLAKAANSLIRSNASIPPIDNCDNVSMVYGAPVMSVGLFGWSGKSGAS